MTTSEEIQRDPGFRIHRHVLSAGEIETLRMECDRLATQAGSACVRHIRKKSERLHALAHDERLLSFLPAGFHVVRSILFDKTPEENWPVAWHQDLTITVTRQQEVPGYGPWSVKDGAVHVQPPDEVLRHMRTLRIHLDDTPASNGALRVVPRSHLAGRTSRETFPAPEHVCECEPGDILEMSPLILHASSRSTTPSRRRIIHFEYAAPGILDPALEWDEPT